MAFTIVNLRPARSPSSSILPTIIWNSPELTAPADMTSCNFLIESPDFAAVASASAVAVQIACAMKLFSSLMTWPEPGGPMWKTFSAKHFSTGSSLAITAGSAPTITFRRPASASTGVRDSGASTKRMPCVAMASLMVTGSPCNGPHTSPAAMAVSASRQRERAGSTASVHTALTAGSTASMRDSCRSSNSSLPNRRFRIAAAWSVALHSVGSLSSLRSLIRPTYPAPNAPPNPLPCHVLTSWGARRA